jgi:hypothetical protein
MSLWQGIRFQSISGAILVLLISITANAEQREKATKAPGQTSIGTDQAESLPVTVSREGQDLPLKPLPPGQALQRIRGRLNQIALKFETRYPETRTIVASVLPEVEYMIRGWKPGTKIPDAYAINLTLDLHMLEKTLESPVEEEPYAVLRDVAEDLKIKADHCRKTGVGLGGLVTLVVRTKRGGQELRELQVLYLPKILEVVKDAKPDLFPKFSSPTSCPLPPGRYVMWTRDPQSNRTGERTVVRVGGGNDTIEWDLPAP